MPLEPPRRSRRGFGLFAFIRYRWCVQPLYIKSEKLERVKIFYPNTHARGMAEASGRRNSALEVARARERRHLQQGTSREIHF